jgi:hypothetical protein
MPTCTLHILRCNEVLRQSVALGHVWTAPWHVWTAPWHVWTAPWQELFDVGAALVGCGHVSGLLMRRVWPLALMLCADQVPIVSTHF